MSSTYNTAVIKLTTFTLTKFSYFEGLRKCNKVSDSHLSDKPEDMVV